MNHRELILFFLQISLMLFVALIFGQTLRKLKQPAVVGELLGGILLGPTVLGVIFPGFYTWLFPGIDAIQTGRNAIINLGMLFFLFVAGLEVNFAQVRRHGLAVLLIAGLGIFIPFAMGFALVQFLPELWSQQSETPGLLLAFFIATALSISALPVIARILIDLNYMKKKVGQLIMASATLNDLVGWTIFAIILSSFSTGRLDGYSWLLVVLVLAFVLFFLTAGRWLGQKILNQRLVSLNESGRLLTVVSIIILAAAASAEAVGIHAIFGAFLVGVALAPNFEKHHRVSEIIHKFALSFFAPIFFVSIGLETNFASNFDFLLAFLVLTVACVGKIFGAGLGARLAGIPLREAMAIGFGLNARGAIEIILASVGLQFNLIDERVFVALIFMAVVTSLLSAPIMHLLLRDSSKIIVADAP